MLVDARGKCMSMIDGAMAAIIGLSSSETERICNNFENVYVANYNCLEQTIISGSYDALSAACIAAREAGARHAFLLDVSIPSHSPWMKPAQNEFKHFIDKTFFHNPVCPVCQNIDGQYYTDSNRIKENLLMQFVSPVQWRDSIIHMMEAGVSEFIEYGPGDTLTELISKIKKGI